MTPRATPSRRVCRQSTEERAGARRAAGETCGLDPVGAVIRAQREVPFADVLGTPTGEGPEWLM